MRCGHGRAFHSPHCLVVCAGLYKGQFITITAESLAVAKNLVARFESVEAAAASCSGWWLGQVRAVITSDGREQEPVDHASLVLQEASSTQKRKGKGRGRDGEGGSTGGPRVIRAKVTWYGHVEAGKLSCLESGPMNSLEVSDIIPRNDILYEQWNPKDIRFKDNCHLFQSSLTKVKGVMPRPYVRPPSEQGHREVVESDPAPHSTYNHAGILIRPSEGPSPAERAMWEEALIEVKGFKWVGRRTAEDPEPPTYQVGNIRRQHGEMFAVVTTSDYGTQYDHRLEDLRRRMFRSLVADKVEALPFMLQWDQFKRSHLTIDFGAIYDNAASYQDMKR